MPHLLRNNDRTQPRPISLATTTKNHFIIPMCKLPLRRATTKEAKYTKWLHFQDKFKKGYTKLYQISMQQNKTIQNGYTDSPVRQNHAEIYEKQAYYRKSSLQTVNMIILVVAIKVQYFSSKCIMVTIQSYNVKVSRWQFTVTVSVRFKNCSSWHLCAPYQSSKFLPEKDTSQLFRKKSFKIVHQSTCVYDIEVR